MIRFFSNQKSASKGFTLVELLVVVAIFIIVTSIVLYNQNKFSSDISISNVTHSLALQIRQAQVYGILVRESRTDFNDAYGIHFRRDPSAQNTIVIDLFADIYPLNGNLRFDKPDSNGANGDEILSTSRLIEGNIISDVCTYMVAGSGKVCFASGGTPLTGADIVFKRPDPSAIITDSSGTDRKAEIFVTVKSSLGDKTRSVKVLNTGQISVNAAVNASDLVSSPF